jgi:hypothetical protein
MELGDEANAWTCHEQALKISREVGNREDEGLALWNMSMFYFRQYQYDIGLAYLVVAKDIFEEIHAPERDEVQRWIDAIRVRFGDDQFTLLMAQIEQAIENKEELNKPTLLRLAFYEHEFYAPSSIDLAQLPSLGRQQPLLEGFRERVDTTYQHRSSEYSLLQMEEKVG